MQFEVFTTDVMQSTKRTSVHRAIPSSLSTDYSTLRLLYEGLSEGVEIESGSCERMRVSIHSEYREGLSSPQSSIPFPRGSVAAPDPYPMSNEKGNEAFPPNAGVGEKVPPKLNG